MAYTDTGEAGVGRSFLLRDVKVSGSHLVASGTTLGKGRGALFQRDHDGRLHSHVASASGGGEP